MAVREESVPDWTYRDARRRLVRAGRAQLPAHTASANVDEEGNRTVTCSCGWTGNGIGWSAHLDDVIRAALQS